MTRRWGLLALAAFLSSAAVAPVASSSHDPLAKRAPGHRHAAEQALAAAASSTSASGTKTSASSSATSPPAGVNTIVILLSTEGGATVSSTSTLPLNGSSLASGAHSASGNLSASTSASGAFASSSSSGSGSASSSSSSSSQITMTITPTITVGPGGATNAAAASAGSDSSSSKVAGLSPGGLAGLIVGIVLGLILLGVVAYFIWKWVSDSHDRREWAAYQNLGPDAGAYMMGGARRPPTEYADSIASGHGGAGFDSRRNTTDWRHSRPVMAFTGASRPGSYANSDLGAGYQRHSYRSERSERWHKGEY